MIELYQNIPLKIDPIAFSIGFFSVRWYAICYLLAFGFSVGLIFWRLEKGEDGNIFGKKNISEKKELILDLLMVGFLGMILGGRLGYVFLYSPSFFLENPLAIFSPFDPESGKYVGIFGMSYFGAVLGIVVFTYFFLRRKKIDFWKAADFFVPIFAGAYFFGRIGNFLNMELFGKKTDFFLGVRFSENAFLRHPTQLYEAFFEGIFIFILLWFFRNKPRFDGYLLILYFGLYSIFRFLIEFFREPGKNELILGDILTKGQVFSIIMLGLMFFIYFQKRKRVL